MSSDKIKKIIKKLQNVRIIMIIMVLVLIISLITSETSYAITNTYTREELQEMVVSTSLSYYYNNIYTDYNQYSKDEKTTINNIKIPGSYMWVNLNTSPEELNRTNKISLACSAFASTVYKHSLGYDFSNHYKTTGYSYFKNNKYYPYNNKDLSPLELDANLYYDTRINQELFQEMQNKVGETTTTYHFTTIAKNALKNENYLTTTGSYLDNNADKNGNIEVYYFEVTGTTTTKLKENLAKINRDAIIAEIKNTLQPGDLLTYRRKLKDENGELTGESTGHVVIYVEDAISKNEKGIIHSTGSDYQYNADGTFKSSGDDRYGVRYDLLDKALDSILVEEDNRISNVVSILRPINNFCTSETCSFSVEDTELSQALDTTKLQNSTARVELSRLKMEQYIKLDKDTATDNTNITNSLSKYNSINIGDIITYNLQIENKANFSYCSKGYYYQNYTTEENKSRSCIQNNGNWLYSERSDEFKYKNLTITNKIPDNVEYVENSCTIIYENVSKEDQTDTCSYNDKTRTITWTTGEIKPNSKQTTNVYSILNPRYTYSYQVKAKEEGIIENTGINIKTSTGNILSFGKLETKVNPTLNGPNISIIKSLVDKTIEKEFLLTYNGMKETNNYKIDITNINNSLTLAEGEYIKMLYYNALGIDLGYLKTNMLNALFNTQIYNVAGTEVKLYTKKLDTEITSLTNNNLNINKMLVKGLYGGRKLKGNDNSDREVITRIKNYSYVSEEGANDLEFGDIIYTYTNEVLNSYMYYGQDENGYSKVLQFTADGIKLYDKNTTPTSFNKVIEMYSADLFWVLRPTQLYGTTINYDYNGGNKLDTSYVAYDIYKNLNTPTKNNYTLNLDYSKEITGYETTFTGINTFDGWYTNKDLTNKITNATTLVKNTNHTIYAKWLNTSIKLPSALIDGYTISGWYSDNELKNKVANPGELYLIKKNQTLYAAWEKIVGFKINKYTHDTNKNIIKNIPIDTNKEQYLEYIITDNNYTKDVELKNNLIYTGSKIKIYYNSELYQELTNIVFGDTNGDGTLSVLDIVKINNHIIDEQKQLEEIYYLAGDYNNDNSLSVLDIVKMNNELIEE